MADVFLAAAQGPAGFSKLQVVKRLRSAELGEETDAVTMFLDEARLAARLNHPNVVQTNEVGESEGEYFIAMEYLDGQPLNRLMHRVRNHMRGPNPKVDAILLKIVADALSGLHYAHELTDYDGTPLNVVHRDVSPHNIFVTYDGQTKVVDFGIAKATTRSSQTSTGVLKGKLSYMAPEQARCKPVDRRADLFIIGIVLWEVLAGRKMWKGLAEMEIVNKIFLQEIPTPEDARPDADPELLNIVRRALAFEAADRYASAADLRDDLLAYLDRSGHRVRNEDTSRLISDLFADRRTHLQAVIDGQLKRLRTVGGAPLVDMNSYLPPPSTRSQSSPTSQQPLPNLSYPATEEPSRTRQAAQPQPPPPSGGRRLLIPVVGGAVAAVVVALLILRGGAPGQAPAADSAAAPPVVAPAAAAPQGPVQPAVDQAAVPKTIELRILASPATAKVYLDDVLLESNPFTGKFPADGARHLVRVEATGHATQKEFARFDEDLTLEFDLEKKTAAVQYRPRRTQTASAQNEPAPQAPADTSAPEPAAAAGTPGKPKRSLSGSDPWSGTPTTAPAAPTDTTAKPKRALSGSDPWAN